MPDAANALPQHWLLQNLQHLAKSTELAEHARHKAEHCGKSLDLRWRTHGRTYSGEFRTSRTTKGDSGNNVNIDSEHRRLRQTAGVNLPDWICKSRFAKVNSPESKFSSKWILAAQRASRCSACRFHEK